MRESELHAHIRDLAAGMSGSFPRVLLGPGDDCAVVRTGQRTLLTVDQVVEGRHFASGTPIDLIARKAVARSISDLAAMACRPVCALATGLLPSGYGHARELTERLHHWANHWSCPIVGGDISTSPTDTPLSLTVTALGELREDEPPVTRAGARAGDVVYVTGALGGSLASGRHLGFEPRVEDAIWLRATLGSDLTSMIDLSDGLGRDGARVALASGVIVEIDGASIPLHAGTAGWQDAAGDGEDYELLFTVRRSLGAVARSPRGTPITRVGRVVALGSDRSTGACIVQMPDGTTIDASEMGWEHG